MHTPVLPTAKADYLRSGMNQVRGWMDASTGVYLASLEVLQHHAGIHGDVCEIGVHHGKSFLAMAIGLPDGERGVAVDVFGDQESNVDQSGKGDRTAFEKNLVRFGVNEVTDVVAASSLALGELGFLDPGRRFRMFSVDGGHTRDITCNDLRLAERTIVDEGVVILDDVLNRHWLGVVSGLFDYWSEGGVLVPCAYVPNKLLLNLAPERAAEYRRLMVAAFAKAQEKSGVPLGSGTIDVYGPASWVVLDVEGRQSLLPGPGHRLPEEERLLPVPESYLRDLEARVNAPLTRELARRYPRLAGIARPVVRPMRRLASLTKH